MIVILKRLNCVKVLWEPYFSHPLMCFPSSIVRKLLKNLSSKWLRWLVVTGRKCVNIETLCYFPCTHSIWRGFQYVHHFSLQLNMWFKQKQIACTLFHDFVHFERIVKWNVTSMGICYFLPVRFDSLFCSFSITGVKWRDCSHIISSAKKHSEGEQRIK